jgi:hypothetical protein
VPQTYETAKAHFLGPKNVAVASFATSYYETENGKRGRVTEDRLLQNTCDPETKEAFDKMCHPIRATPADTV